MELTRDAVAWSRLTRSGLIDGYASAVDTARALVGVQSQFVPPAGLAIRARTVAGFAASDLDASLHEHKELVRLWGLRNTVHVYDTKDWPTIVSATGSVPSYRERLTTRLGRSEDEFERALARVEEILLGVERASRADLVAADPTLKEWFGYGPMLVADLTRRGAVCHAGLEGGKSYFSHREVWLPGMPWTPPSADEAGATLARRYFSTYGPATVRDFAFWTGARASAARRWVDSVRHLLSGQQVDGEPMLVGPPAKRRVPSRSSDPPPRARWPLRLLHRFDPLLLAHKDKSWLVDDEHYKAVWRKAGYVEAVVLKRGRIAGTWGYRKKARGLEIAVAPFVALGARDLRSLEREAESVADYFEVPLMGLEVK